MEATYRVEHPDVKRPDVEHLTVLEIARQYPPPGWEQVFKWADPELQVISMHLQNAGKFYPPKRDLFRAFDECPLPKIKALILGQDPYHGEGQANGLAFAVNRGIHIPPSEANIFTELEREFNIEETKGLIQHWESQQSNKIQELEQIKGLYPEVYCEEIQKIWPRDALVKMALKIRPVFQRPLHGDLTKWAHEGVLLLNTCLTVAPHQPKSHGGIWNGFVAKILASVNSTNPECVGLYWGASAIETSSKMGQRSIKIFASHPSPYSANRKSRDVPAFIGSNCFKQANDYLLSRGKEPIDWTLN